MFEVSDQMIDFSANILSTMTILSCLFLKVPQITQIHNRKSAEGIYFQAMLMEISGFSIVTLYNYTNKYNVLTYLEYPIILLQIYVLLFFTLKYKGLLESRLVPFGVLFYISIISAFALQIFPKDILAYLVPLCTPLSGFAKVTYIYGIIKAGNADAVSLMTWVISLLTNMSRLFTIYVDSKDSKLMFNFVVSSLLSGGVLLTAIYYQMFRKPTKPPKETKKD